MFNQIRRLSKVAPQVRATLPPREEEVKKEAPPSELKVPDGSFKGENIRIAGRRLIFLTLKQCLALDNEIVCFDVSYENNLLISCSENILNIWNLRTMEIEQRIEIKLRNKRGEKEYIKIICCAISKDGNYIITVMSSKMIIWNRNTGKLSMILELPVETHYIKFSDNGGEYLYSSGEDGIVRTWDWKAGKQISLKLSHPASVRTFDFTHSIPYRFICGRVDGHCTAWNFDTQEVIDNIIPDPTWDGKKNEANRGGWINPESNHTGAILCLRISPNKRLLATSSMDFTCKLWNIASYSKDAETVKQERLKENIDFNGLIDITMPYERDKYGIRIGEVPFCTGFHADIMFTYRHEAPVTIIEFNSTSDILYTGSTDSTCRLWSTRKGELIFQINLPASPQSLYVTPGPANDMLYLSCQNRLLVFDIKCPTQEQDLPVYWRAGEDSDIEINYNKIYKHDHQFENGRLYTGQHEGEKIPFELDEFGNEIDKNDVSKINIEKGKYSFEEIRKLLSHGLIRDTYIKTMIDELRIGLPEKQLFSNVKKYNINLTQVLRTIINDQYKPVDVIKALYTKDNKIMRKFSSIINKGEPLKEVMTNLGFKQTSKEILDNSYIFLSSEDIRPITTVELKEMIKNDVFKYAFNQMFSNLNSDTLINDDEEMLHKVLHFIPAKHIKLIKDYQKNKLNQKVFIEELDPKISAPARYPNFKKTDKQPEVKSIAPTSENIGRVKRFDENRLKTKAKPEGEEKKEPQPVEEEPIEINLGKGYLPLNTKLSSLTKQQRQDLIDLYMDRLFGSENKDWKSSGNILHYERYLQAKGLNINWPFPKYHKKKNYPIKNIRNPILSHIYVQPILINQNQNHKNEIGVGLSQLLVGKKIEIQEKKPDLNYKNNPEHIRKVSNIYSNLPGESSVKVKSLQKLDNMEEEANNDNYSNLHSLVDQVSTLNVDTTTNKQTVSSSSPKRNENSVINANMRRLSNLNNTLYKVPELKKKDEPPKKLEFHRVMRISSYVDYKDDIEEIEKAIKLSSNMNLINNSRSNNENDTTAPRETNIPEIKIEDEHNYNSNYSNNIQKSISLDKNNANTISDNNSNNNNNNENVNSDNKNTNEDIAPEDKTQNINNSTDITENTITNTEEELITNNEKNSQNNNDEKGNENEDKNKSITESKTENNNGNIAENNINENNNENNNEDNNENNNESNNKDNNENNNEDNTENNNVYEKSDDADNNNDINDNNNNNNNNINSNESNETENNPENNNQQKEITDDNDDKMMQEERERLLLNEMNKEKELDYHPFVSSTRKLSTEQKVDEIIVNEKDKENIVDINSINDDQ
jgi:WD40 repeat protein